MVVHASSGPSSRCASAIQIVRPLESIAETQPKLQPALLRLSAMISQYFNASTFSDCSERFPARVCLVRALRSLSVGPP